VILFLDEVVPGPRVWEDCLKDFADISYAILDGPKKILDNLGVSLIIIRSDMARRGELQAIKKIRTDPILHRAPIIVFLSPRNAEKVSEIYHLGVNAIIVKSLLTPSLMQQFRLAIEFWFKFAERPSSGENSNSSDP